MHEYQINGASGKQHLRNLDWIAFRLIGCPAVQLRWNDSDQLTTTVNGPQTFIGPFEHISLEVIGGENEWATYLLPTKDKEAPPAMAGLHGDAMGNLVQVDAMSRAVNGYEKLVPTIPGIPLELFGASTGYGTQYTYRAFVQNNGPDPIRVGSQADLLVNPNLGIRIYPADALKMNTQVAMYALCEGAPQVAGNATNVFVERM